MNDSGQSARDTAGSNPSRPPLAETELDAIADGLPYLVWICGSDRSARYLNPQWVAYTGAAAEVQLGPRWMAALNDDDRGRLVARWSIAAQAEESFDIELRIRGGDGVQRWFRTRAIPLRDGSGKITKWYASSIDIDAQRRSLDALKHNEERLRIAQEAAEIGAFEWNVETGTNVWTPELERIHGLAPGAFAGTQRAWEELLHPDDRPDAIAAVERALKSWSTVECEWRIHRPDGNVRWIVGRFRALRDEHGHARSVIGVNIDITARKHAETAVRRLNEGLEKLVVERTARLIAANRELEAFAYSVAHDLRAPLRGVHGFAGILLEDHASKLDADALRCLAQIQGNATQMDEIIDALLSLSRVTRGDTEESDVDLSAIAANVIADLARTEPERVVQTSIAPDLYAWIDARLARRLLENLLGNAWKFTRGTSSAFIAFDATTIEGARALRVRDNGAGFDMAHANKLFAPFQRLHRVGEYPGTGIGLATVHRIVTRYGGRIWAEARPGEGATFCFTLPEERSPA